MGNYDVLRVLAIFSTLKLWFLLVTVLFWLFRVFDRHADLLMHYLCEFSFFQKFTEILESRNRATVANQSVIITHTNSVYIFQFLFPIIKRDHPRTFRCRYSELVCISWISSGRWKFLFRMLMGRANSFIFFSFL